GSPSFDVLVEGRIDPARKNGRDVVVFDLGAGDGNISRDFLSAPAFSYRTRRKLAGGTVSTRVRFYSVTDSPTAQDHFMVTPFTVSADHGNEQLDGHQVHYSITTSQSIPRLFDCLNVPSADLIVANSFL